MTYICKLELKEGHVAKYAITLCYKKHWYNKYNKCYLKLLCNNKELNEFIEGYDMDSIIKLIKDKLIVVVNDYEYDKDIKIRIDGFNDKFNKIKVKL